MLDPSRYSLDAATVGFRKRMRQSVNWGNFTEALQTQTESIKVRRELEETPISEVHVMGGQRYGWAGNSKTNEIARQERQMNGYPLRSFYATGGAIVVPPKRSEGVLATPMNIGLTSYAQYNGVVGNYVSAFTEPLNAPLDSGVMALARAGRQARSEAIENPYKFLQFQLNMHATMDQIQKNEERHKELRGYNEQGNLAQSLGNENFKQAILAQQTHKAMKQSGASHIPGSGTALHAHLPNQFQTPAPMGSSEMVTRQNEMGNEDFNAPELDTTLQNYALLDPRSGVEIANLEDTAREERRTGQENTPALQMLRELSEGEREYVVEAIRGDFMLRDYFENASDEERQQYITAMLRDKDDGWSPIEAARRALELDRDDLMAMHTNDRLVQTLHVNTPMQYTVAPYGPDMASRISDATRPNLDGLQSVERLNTQLALADEFEGQGANGLILRNGNMQSFPNAGTPFVQRNNGDGSALYDLNLGADTKLDKRGKPYKGAVKNNWLKGGSESAENYKASKRVNVRVNPGATPYKTTKRAYDTPESIEKMAKRTIKAPTDLENSSVSGPQLRNLFRHRDDIDPNEPVPQKYIRKGKGNKKNK